MTTVQFDSYKAPWRADGTKVYDADGRLVLDTRDGVMHIDHAAVAQAVSALPEMLVLVQKLNEDFQEGVGLCGGTYAVLDVVNAKVGARSCGVRPAARKRRRST